MKLSPFRIVAIYLVVAMIWIASTDSIIGYFVQDIDTLAYINIAKGWLFVISTAIGLFYLIKIYEKEVDRERLNLEKKDQSLTQALETNKMATWEYYPDVDRFITSSNHHSLYNLPQSEDLKLKDIFSRIHPDELDRYRDEILNTLDSHQDLNIEYRVVHPDGSIHWLWTRGSVKLSNGEIESITGITSDVTESKTLRRKLDLEREKSEMLFDRIPVLITVYNPEININEVNREFEKVLGYDPSKEYAEDPLSIFYPDENVRKEAIRHMSNPGGGWKEFEVWTTSGEKRYQLWSNIQLSDSTIVGIGHDITERKDLELKEKRSRDRLLDIFNKLPIFINIIDDNDVIIESNDFMKEKLGYSEKDITKGNLIETLLPDNAYQEAKSHIQTADNSWKDFDLFTNSGEKLKTCWMNMQLDDTYKLGVGIDLTEVRELEEQLSLSVKGGSVGLWDYYPKEQKIQINDEYANMLGYTKEELEPRVFNDWTKLIHPNDFEKSVEQMALHFERDIPSYRNEIRLKHKDNGWIWVLVRGEVTERDDHGEVIRFTGTHIDITERKILEEQIEISRTRLKQATNSANIGLWEWNPQTGDVTIDEIWARLIGYSIEELEPVNIDTWNRLVHPGDLKRFEKTIDDYFSGKTSIYEIEVRMRHKDGHWVWILDRGKNLEWNDAGEPTKMIGTHVDITTLKLNEKRLEENECLLEEEQGRLRTITSIVSDVIWEWNFESDSISWSEGMEALFGYKAETMPADDESWKAHIHPEDKNRVLEGIKEARYGSRSNWTEEYRFIDSSGKIRYVLDQGYIFRDEEGKAHKMVGAMIDQTEAKESEQLLSGQAQLLEDISDAVIATDESMRITSWNRAAEMMYGWSEQEAIGNNINQLIKTVYEKVDNNDDVLLRKIIKNGEWSSEVVQYNRLDEPMNIMSSVRTISDEEGNFKGTVAVNKDITAIKKIQEKLSYEQRRFEYATFVVSDAIWDANPCEGFVWWSEGLATHYGHEVPSPELGYDIWKDNLHSEDKERVLSSMKRAEESGAAEWEQEYKFYRGDGSLATVLDRALILRNESGDIERIIGAMNDVTVEKEAEKDLKRSEQQYRLLYEQSPLPMYIYDKTTLEFLSVNEAFIDLFGYSKKEFSEMKIFDLFLSEEQEQIKQEIHRNLQSSQSEFDIWRQKTKCGSTLFCEISGSDIHFKGDQQRLVVALDITEQRKADERAIKAIVEGEERERHRIANELHDGLGQYLSAANMHLNTVYEDSESLPESIDHPFRTGLQMLEHAISETRSISHNLLPKAIQDYGLKMAVESLVNEIQSTQTISVHLFQKYDDGDLPGNIQINIFRIIQEALNNALKHSGGSSININVVYSDREIICAVEDNGKGFNTEHISREGLGLQSMKTRVAAMSGNLDIESKEGKGTVITAIVPI